MLGAMDVPAAAAGPWIALGAVLGALLLLTVGAATVRLRSRTPPPAPAVLSQPVDEPRDDLADFLAHPPGTPHADGDEADDEAHDDGVAWAPLGTAAARPAPPAALAAAPGSHPGTVLAGLAVVALLLVGVAAALATSARMPEPAADSAPDTAPSDRPAPSSGGSSPGPAIGRGVIEARLVFDGVVLEEHAVGITAAYPEVELTLDGERGVARLRLPTANCLAASAPPTAGDPTCRAARTEFAELSAPDLRVERHGDELVVSGRFTTYLRPTGSSEVPTGRSYELTVTVAPVGTDRDGWLLAEGRIQWDDQRASTRTGGPPNVLRSGG